MQLGHAVDRRDNVPPGMVVEAGERPVGGQEPVGDPSPTVRARLTRMWPRSTDGGPHDPPVQSTTPTRRPSTHRVLAGW